MGIKKALLLQLFFAIQAMVCLAQQDNHPVQIVNRNIDYTAVHLTVKTKTGKIWKTDFDGDKLTVVSFEKGLLNGQYPYITINLGGFLRLDKAVPMKATYEYSDLDKKNTFNFFIADGDIKDEWYSVFLNFQIDDSERPTSIIITNGKRAYVITKFD
jgi:hypothetical protein